MGSLSDGIPVPGYLLSSSSDMIDNDPEPCNSCPLISTITSSSIYPSSGTRHSSTRGGTPPSLTSSLGDWLSPQLSWVGGGRERPDSLLGVLKAPPFSQLDNQVATALLHFSEMQILKLSEELSGDTFLYWPFTLNSC